jgi:hypothetical protein
MAALPPELWIIIFKHLRRLLFLDRIKSMDQKLFKVFLHSRTFVFKRLRSDSNIIYRIYYLNDFLTVHVFPRFVSYICICRRNAYTITDYYTITYNINFIIRYYSSKLHP